MRAAQIAPVRFAGRGRFFPASHENTDAENREMEKTPLLEETAGIGHPRYVAGVDPDRESGPLCVHLGQEHEMTGHARRAP